MTHVPADLAELCSDCWAPQTALGAVEDLVLESVVHTESRGVRFSGLDTADATGCCKRAENRVRAPQAGSSPGPGGKRGVAPAGPTGGILCPVGSGLGLDLPWWQL